ncbi:MAG: ABC transporter permease [Candidatus Thorarchaeota archaeon]
MGLREYVIRRIIYMVILVIAVICFNFFLFRLPTFLFGASPVSLMLSDELRRNLTQDLLEQMYANFGLVQNPDIFDWIYMFWRYIVSMFTGNFGVSFQNRQPVIEEIVTRLPNTLLLMGTSSMVAILLGIWTGVKVAAEPGSRKDVSAVTLALFIYALPVFWLGMMLLLVFGFMLPEWTEAMWGIRLGFPQFGTISYEVWEVARTDPFGALYVAGDVLHHLTLPMITLGVGGYGGYFLYMRNNLNLQNFDSVKENRCNDRRLHLNCACKGIRREPSVIQAWSEECNAPNGNNNRNEFWLSDKRCNANRNGIHVAGTRVLHIHESSTNGLPSYPNHFHDNCNYSNSSEFRCGLALRSIRSPNKVWIV